MGLVEALGQLPTAQLFFHKTPIELADDFGFLRVTNDLRDTAMPFGQIPLAVTMIRPRHKLSPARFLQPSTPGTFVNLGAFIFCHHSLHLGEKFSLWGIAERILQKKPLDVEFLKLFDQ